MKHLTIFLSLFLSWTVQVNAQKVYSELWGKKGEKWNKERVPDFTEAGYMKGERPIPIFRKKVNVRDFGAVNDGLTDNIAAFRKALNACGKETTLYIPGGRYYLSDSLLIKKSDVVIKGEGEGKTVILFKKGLEELYPDYGKKYKTQTKWSWRGAMITFEGDISNVGIENLTIEFPDSLYAGHNWHERGYNAIGFSEGANNGWVRNVTMIGCDMGIWIDRPSHHITAEGWKLIFGDVRKSRRLVGHHGVNIYGGHNLLQHFYIGGTFEHDLSVESEYSIFNVFRKGGGIDLCIDHHNHDQRNNLFTDLDAGLGKRLYYSGGASTPRGISFNETYWNITGDSHMPYCNHMDNATLQSKNNVGVAIKTKEPSVLGDKHGNWFETIDPMHIYPRDLYEAQMKYNKK